MTSPLEDFLSQYVALYRAMHLWFHGAHNVTRGVGFAGDHSSLYERIYTTIQEDTDNIIEKAVGLTGIESMACPVKITGDALSVLKRYPSPAALTSLGIAAAGDQLITDFLKYSTDMFYELEDAGGLSLGLNDFIMAHANSYETFVYLLRQRVKTDVLD